MLFDLRSKSRRNTVRVVYVILALLMLSGLLLVGVGTGNGGGLLNAFSNNGGSTSGESSLIKQATSSAIKQTKAHPDSYKAWAALVQARFTAAGTGTNYDSTTDTYAPDGKKQLNDGVAAWNRYLSLTSGKPGLQTSTLFQDTALLATRIFQGLQQWSGAAAAWEYVIQSQPAGSGDAVKGYECLALNSFAAGGGETSKAELAAAAAKKLLPKSSRADWQTIVTGAKSSKSTAAQYVTANC